MKEDTSSSESGLHFGHYKAGSHSQPISHFHVLKATLLMKRGILLDRWGRGLSVMIKKMFGCNLVSKLHSILLMEADFNFTNKEFFGRRMMSNIHRFNLMLEEIFSEKNITADDGTLVKVLFFDTVWQTRRTAGVASVDAENCFDRGAHAMASLVFQAFGVKGQLVETMLATIQEMNFFLYSIWRLNGILGVNYYHEDPGPLPGQRSGPGGLAGRDHCHS